MAMQITDHTLEVIVELAKHVGHREASANFWERQGSDRAKQYAQEDRAEAAERQKTLDAWIKYAKGEITSDQLPGGKVAA